jgi:hypothetical protein
MLKKVSSRPGINRENTRYFTENGYYECDKIRFRQGSPEKIGGWEQLSSSTFLGVCRALWGWTTLSGLSFIGVGTHLKFYIENGGLYYDITPLRVTRTLNGPFTSNGTTTVTVTDAGGGFTAGDFVTFSNATTVGGVNINGEYQIQSTPTASTYTITAPVNVPTTVGGGGSAARAAYQIPVGSATNVPLVGWGAGGWGLGPWGVGGTTTQPVRLWNQQNFGQDLVYGPRGGAMYYWNAAIGLGPNQVTISVAAPAVVTATVTVANNTTLAFTSTGVLPTGLTAGTVYYAVNSTGSSFQLALTPGGAAIATTLAGSGTHFIDTRGIPLPSLAFASDAPVVHNALAISDTSRFVLAMGVNDYGSTVQDPMLIRWSDQESAASWTPSATNQAGSMRLSHGSAISTALQSRQEILVWTDSALYSLQYLGPPVVWGSQILADNISIVGPNAVAFASGVAYWMGVDKFYKYDGRTQTLRCDIRRFIYSDINLDQASQIFCGTNEGFNEVWWFYCSAGSQVVDRYAVFNYTENNGEGAWYYGTLRRTAWLDSGLRNYPIAANYDTATQRGKLIYHEYGLNDNETGTPLPIQAYILTSEFDIDDGDSFAFVWRVLPDITFRGSTAASPTVTMTLYPLQNAGSGYNNPLSQGGVNYGSISRSTEFPVEVFTGQINVRVRGRQLAFKVESNQLDTIWQLGSPRIDVRPDGRKS